MINSSCVTLRSCQTMATSQRNIPTQQITTLLGQYLEAPAKRSQHIATLLGTTSLTSCVRLVTLLWRVAACCELKIELVRMPWRNIVARTWQKDYNIMQNPQMLRQKFDLFYQNISANNTQHGATRRNMVAKRTQNVAPKNVAICCVEMLPGLYASFVLSKLPACSITR